MPGAEVYLVTGIQAAGKSTVAQLLAEQFPRSVHVRGDLFRRMIVNGRAEITPELADEAVAKLALRARTPRIGLWLDASAQTPDETVAEILARAPAEAAVSYRHARRP